MDLGKGQRECPIGFEKVQSKGPGVTVTYIYVFTSRFVTLVICMLDCPDIGDLYAGLSSLLRPPKTSGLLVATVHQCCSMGVRMQNWN